MSIEMKRKIFMMLLCLVFIFSCSRDVTTYKKLQRFCDEVGVDINEYKFVAFINVDACSSCSTFIKDFLAINADNLNLLIVLSSLSRKKARFLVDGYDGQAKIIIDKDRLGLNTYLLHKTKPLVYATSQTHISMQEFNLPEFSKLWVYGFFTRE